MTCLTGVLAPVAVTNRSAYLDFAKAAWPVLQKHGARGCVEAWGVDLPHGKINDLYTSVQAQDGEAVVFSWIEWADLATAQRAMTAMRDAPEMAEMAEMPYDGKRMIFGNFSPLLLEGSTRGATYLQGFVLAVPNAKKDAYAEIAAQGWTQLFQPNGCLGMFEGWGKDVPHGKLTDFYRATLAQADETPLFSWLAWPDKETCTAAASVMEEASARMFPAGMPFDTRRMMWGGFDIIMDTRRP